MSRTVNAGDGPRGGDPVMGRVPWRAGGSLKIAAFTPGWNVSSARFRVRQYRQPLSEHGVRLEEYWATLGAFPPVNHRYLRPAWGVATLVSRFPSILSTYRADVTWLQREMLSTYETLELFCRRPRLWDIDDAVWLHRQGKWAHRFAGHCDGVICGNEYVADWVSRANSRVEIVPTGVDTRRFVPKDSGSRAERLVLGWMGQSAGYPFLETALPAVAHILQKQKDAVLRVISDRPPQGPLLQLGSKLEYRQWSAAREVRDMQEFDIGLMPLEESDWCKGKCSFKMLLYMACGLPVVVSPVGMNKKVLSLGDCGFGPRNLNEWTDALEKLIASPETREKQGKAGRRIVEIHYSLDVLSPRLARLFRRYR